jgi:hypothetical protein
VYQTPSGASFMPAKMIEDVEDFLVHNRAYILPHEKTSEAFKTRFFGHSLLSDLVYRLNVSGVDKEFALLRLPSKTVALREAVDQTFVPIDLLQMKEMTTTSSTRTLSLIPELNDKLVINITDITKANGDFLDASRFYNRVVRDFLSRHYYNSTSSAWISTSLVRYVAKVYSMTIGGNLAKLFGLTLNVQLFVQSIFCAFYIGKMTSIDIAEAFMKAHAKPLGLPQGTDLQQILAMMHDVLGKAVPQTLEEVFKVIDAYDHDQLNNARLSRAVLNAKLASITPDKPVAAIAMEYPPYFLFLIMQVLSAERIGLSFSMKNLNLLNEGKEVLSQVVKTPSFFDI